MILFLAIYGVVLIWADYYVANDERKARNEKLRIIQRKLARREAAEKSQKISA